MPSDIQRRQKEVRLRQEAVLMNAGPKASRPCAPGSPAFSRPRAASAAQRWARRCCSGLLGIAGVDGKGRARRVDIHQRDRVEEAAAVAREQRVAVADREISASRLDLRLAHHYGVDQRRVRIVLLGSAQRRAAAIRHARRDHLGLWPREAVRAARPASRSGRTETERDRGETYLPQLASMLRSEWACLTASRCGSARL